MTISFSELKRRNVIRVGAAYLVAAWLIVQVVDVLIDMLGIPNWTGQILVVLLAVGFPFTLLFAWAYEITPEGVIPEGEVDRSRSITDVTARRLDMITIGLVVTAMLIFAADRLFFSTLGTASTVAVPGAVRDASVAVLPFANISDDDANVAFTVGIHDDLLTQISKIGALKTISRTSVLSYRETTKPIRQIALELGVATILEGAVQRAGDRVRVNVQLIDPTSNEQLWAERYDRLLTAGNIFVIQSEIVKAIADALETTLSPDEQQRLDAVPTENLEALDLYFLGRQRIAERNTDSFEQAIEYFQQAIELDPDFALAYVGLADSYQLQEDAGSLPRDEMYLKAEPLLEKALELDDQLAQAYTSQAGLRWTAGDYGEAESKFRTSIDLNPNYSTSYLWYGLLLTDQGRIDEAIGVYRRGIERDPLSSQLNESLGIGLEYRGRFDDALKLYQRAVDVNSTFSTSYMAMGNVHWQASGLITQAVACHRRSIDMDPGARLPQVWHGLLYLDLGLLAEAQRWLVGALDLAPQALEPLAANALLDLHIGDVESARRRATAAQQINAYWPDARMLQSMALSILRDREARNGNAAGAVTWYETSHPALLADTVPVIDQQNYRAAIDLAWLLQQTGDDDRATFLLDRARAFIEAEDMSRLGIGGFGIADVQIHALNGDGEQALAALRTAIEQGWRGFWWFHLRHNPNLAALHDNADFQALVLKLESSMTDLQSTLNDSAVCSDLWAYDSAHGW